MNILYLINMFMNLMIRVYFNSDIMNFFYDFSGNNILCFLVKCNIIVYLEGNYEINFI